MGVHDRNDSSMDPVGIRRRLPRRWFVMGCGLLVLLAFFGFWLLCVRRGDDDHLADRFPPGVLADYVPEDSAAVIAVNLRHLLETPIGRQHLRAFLRQLMAQAERQLPWLEWTGIKPFNDLDTILISLASEGGGGPLLLARGRIEPSCFQIEPNKLHPKVLDHFRVWEYSDRAAKQTTLLAPVSDMLVVSETRSRVQAALKQASDPQPIRARDASLRELLTKVDRQQPFWLAASIKDLGPVSEIDNYLLKMLLRPLFVHAESVYGGISCAEDLRAELHFRTATENDAAQLETELKSIRDLAREGPWLLGRQKELLPLLRLLAASQIRREGQSILLRCRLTADELTN